MLRPITPVCQPALDACHALQTRLVLWLCESGRKAADVTATNLCTLHASPIAGSWLIAFLDKKLKDTKLLKRAKVIAGLPTTEKGNITAWLNASNNTASQFQNPPPVWPAKPTCSEKGWAALRELLESFYTKGLGEGLPFDETGSPVATGGVDRESFVKAFKSANGEITCILCDGPLGSPEVDHWIAKKHYPSLSTCSHNLIPICHECNSRANKGEKPVWADSANAFDDWFHPVFRSANGWMEPRHQTMQAIKVVATSPVHTNRVNNLDKLIKLSDRWTSEFKMQFNAYKKTLRGKISRGRITATQVDLASELHEFELEIADENPLKANSVIRKLTLSTMQEPAKLGALLTELTT